MAAIEQGQLRISGIPCDSPPFRLQISQGFNRHGRMTAGLWIPEETRKELHLNMQVILELDGGGPVFCGVVERATAGKEKGQDCVYLEARTGSCLLDRKKSVNYLMIELPEYKLPDSRTVAIYVWEKIKDYLEKAGTTIFIATLAIWLLLNFGPHGYSPDMAQSFGAMIGKCLVPFFAPIGLGFWQIAVALIAGVSAKEVVVSSCAVLFGIVNAR